MTIRLWASAVAALIALLLAAMFWSVGVASECSTPPEPAWLPGLASFALFVACGAYVMGAGDRRLRVGVFVLSGLVVVGYVWGLTQSLPLVYQTEISCAADGARPLR
jgi:hypothetical protein